MRQKRFLSWIMVFTLLVGMFSFPAYAEGNTTTTTISGDGTADKTGTMTITLEIPKKTPAATDLTYTAPSELTYSGSDKVATVAAASGVTGLGAITVKYYSDAARTTEATPKNVGTYYVGATVAEGDQYAASTAVLYGDGWTFEITKSTPTAPAAPTKASATKNSITLNAVSGCEYSKDGANWQSGTEFAGLLPGTEYTFYQRVKATANTNASAASSASFSTEADTYAMTITLVIKPAQTITASDVTIDKINELKEPYDEAKVKEAREAYNKLTDEQKNDSKVKEALKKLEEAEAAIENEKAEKAAREVSGMIEDLPTADKVTIADKATIESAREAYDSLTDDQKKKVSEDTLKKLVDAETALAAAQVKAVKSVTVSSKTISAKTLKAAITKAGGSSKYVNTIVIGKNVNKISKNAFKNCGKTKTLVIKSKKLKKSTVKNSLKGSKITKVKVKVGNKKTNKKYVKKYKTIFTKKNAGRKVKVSL